jgi:hypothetical protein
VGGQRLYYREFWAGTLSIYNILQVFGIHAAQAADLLPEVGLDLKICFIYFFYGLFLRGVYNMRKVKTVGGSDSILFYF